MRKKRNPKKPASNQQSKSTPLIPDFMARLKKIYGDKPLKVSGAELISRDRDRL